LFRDGAKAIVYEVQSLRRDMTRRTAALHLTALALVFLMISSVVGPNLNASLSDDSIQMEAEGRQDTLDVDCSGYTFEDLFEYDFALFELSIFDDWATGDMYANAWVNGSNSPIVRDNLDGLFEGLPGGGNDWISTDERDAVRSIGPKCIADMETRLGMREGTPHSGGVDWNDFEFVEDGIGLDEVNLVPAEHQEARTCTNFGAAQDCKEVPVSVTDDMEINLDVADGQTNNVRWDQLNNQGVSNFTVALNITNMSNAALIVTFPVLSGLRMYDFRVTDNTPESGDNCNDIGAPSSTYLPDGALQLTQLVTFDRTQWDLICNVFMDFTTQIPEVNDIPLWTSSAPENGTRIATSGGTTMFADADTGNQWATDDDGWSLDCTFDADGWSLSTNVLGDFFVTQSANSGDSAQATCVPVDPLGAKDENNTRTWEFGELFTSTAVVSEDGKTVVMTVTPTGFIDEFIIYPHAVQDGYEGLDDATASVSAAGTDVTISLEGIRPGSFSIAGVVQATNMLPYSFMLDLGTIKPNSPPELSVAVNFDGDNATWDSSGIEFTLYGLASDPDLEAVSLSLKICEAETSGFVQDNINWQVDVSIAICMANGLENYDVIITATDESGASASLTVGVNPPVLGEDPTLVIEPAEDGALPSLSMLAVLSMVGIAALLGRRNEE
tara:strand:- start:876 stop:2885 length:2010 start_codon:yes stop_codon:yes gene_type:complete